MRASTAVNYWPGNREAKPRIVFTSGRNLIALDAATGLPASGFGEDGIIDVGLEWSGVPVIFRDVLAVGSRVIETPQDPNAPGDTRAFDAVTGAQKWVFHSVPRPGEVGHDTWLNDGWRDRSGTNVWAPHMAVDEDLGLLYFALSSPSSNYYGGDRPVKTSLGTPLWQWKETQENIDGTSNLSIMISGITTTLARLHSSTSDKMEKQSRPWRTLVKPGGCSFWTVVLANLFLG